MDQHMLKKSMNQLVRKLRDEISGGLRKDFAELRKELAEIKTEVKVDQTENNRLIREYIVEQRQRDDKHGGVLQISEREIATRIFNDLIMYLDPQDIAITPHIVFEGIWERWVTMAWLSALDSQPGVVLDIGANNGYYGMLAANRLNKKDSNVILFEPNPQLIPYIQKTLSVNWLNENTTLEPVAVADTVGNAELNVLKDYIGSSSMQPLSELDTNLSHKMQIEAEEVVDVETITIDAYCKKHGIKQVDLVIMDIEGFEEKAYAGMQAMVSKSPNLVLFIEFTPTGYKNPKRFYGRMLEDFGLVYTLSPKGEFVKPKKSAYESVIADKHDYVMLVFSKQRL